MRWWPARRKRTDDVVPEEPQHHLPREISGPAHVISDEVDASGYVPGDVDRELARLVDAVRDVDRFLTELGLHDAQYQDVFRTQNAILHDVTWTRSATGAITNGASAPTAVFGAFSDISGMFDAIPNATLRERGTDVRSMSRLVRSALVGAPLRRPEGEPGSVWIVPELDAATAVQLTPENCAGVVATSDLVSGHGIEVATSRGFTCITGREDADEAVEGEPVTFASAPAQSE